MRYIYGGGGSLGGKNAFCPPLRPLFELSPPPFTPPPPTVRGLGVSLLNVRPLTSKQTSKQQNRAAIIALHGCNFFMEPTKGGGGGYLNPRNTPPPPRVRIYGQGFTYLLSCCFFVTLKVSEWRSCFSRQWFRSPNTFRNPSSVRTR